MNKLPLLLLFLSFFLMVTSKSEKNPKEGYYEENKQQQKKKILLLVPGFPWQFGAYQNQQALLGRELIRRGYDVYWNAAFRELKSLKMYNAKEVMRACVDYDPPPIKNDRDLEVANLFRYIGVKLPEAYRGRGRGVLASAVNVQLKRYSIDAIICLLDANQVLVDVPFHTYSIFWFPNHFSHLIDRQQLVLVEYDAVAPLAPSDAEMLRNPKYNLKRVQSIPHIIETPPDFSSSRSIKSLRKKYGIPVDAWVIMMNCGNYENSNRKSIDLALMAFKAFKESVPEAFLLMKSISYHEILMSEGHASHVVGKQSGLPMDDLIEIVGLSSSSYSIITEIKEPNAAWEMMKLADTLLMPSKTEGFGCPMVEAQLVGTPVVTTRFGAMKDYTINGISVPPAQPHFLDVGMAVMPDLHGVIAALKLIHAGGLSHSAAHSNTKNLTTMAIEYITKDLSSEAVGQQFDDLLEEGIERNAADPSHKRYTVDRVDSDEDEERGDDLSSAKDWYYSLPYEDTMKYKTLRKMTGSEAPRWTLLWSNALALDVAVLESMGKGGWAALPPPIDAEVLFLLARRQDGTEYPKDSELLNGILEPNGAVLIRTDRLLAAAKDLHVEMGIAPSAFNTLRGALGGRGLLSRPMEIKILHTVVATAKVGAITRQFEAKLMGE